MGVVVVRVSALPRYSSHRSCFVSWTCIESTVPNGRSAGVQSSVTMTMTSVGRVCCRRESTGTGAGRSGHGGATRPSARAYFYLSVPWPLDERCDMTMTTMKEPRKSRRGRRIRGLANADDHSTHARLGTAGVAPSTPRLYSSE